jgi:VIT1/CCC1 family predicted Fe2+/Mn2+ transporter
MRGTTEAIGGSPLPKRVADADARTVPGGEPSRMSIEEKDGRSLMDATGLGLLPGLALATGLLVVVMAALLTGSMWAVAGVLVIIGICLAAVVFVVLAVTAEGEEGRRIRRMVPGLSEQESTKH